MQFYGVLVWAVPMSRTCGSDSTPAGLVFAAQGELWSGKASPCRPFKRRVYIFLTSYRPCSIIAGTMFKFLQNWCWIVRYVARWLSKCIAPGRHNPFLTITLQRKLANLWQVAKQRYRKIRIFGWCACFRKTLILLSGNLRRNWGLASEDWITASKL